VAPFPQCPTKTLHAETTKNKNKKKQIFYTSQSACNWYKEFTWAEVRQSCPCPSHKGKLVVQNCTRSPALRSGRFNVAKTPCYSLKTRPSERSGGGGDVVVVDDDDNNNSNTSESANVKAQ
jgi:hypothetical protein